MERTDQSPIPDDGVRRSRWRENRLLFGSLVVGLGIRLWWIMVTTPSSFSVNDDPYEYLAYARALTDLVPFTINGHVTAFFAPGWPIILAPMVYLSRKTGWYSPEFGASVVSMLIGVAVIYLSAHLAGIWFGRRCRNLTAWLVALAPGLIGVTSTALSEAPFSALLLSALIFLSGVLRRKPVVVPRLASLFLFGTLVGYLALVRGQGIIVLPLAAGLLWYHGRSFALVRRATLGVLLGVVAVLGPMTIRNGLVVGYWSPTSTDQAASMCMGHSDGANGGYVNDYGFLYKCHSGSPYVAQRDGEEARWATRTALRAMGWAVTHPRREVALTVHKTWLVLGQDRNAGAISYLSDLKSIPENWVDPALRVIGAWRVLALLLAGIALLRDARGRHAPIIWLTPTLLLMTCWAGADAGRMNLPLLPFLAILAAAFLSTVKLPRPAPRASRDATDEADEGDEADEAAPRVAGAAAPPAVAVPGLDDPELVPASVHGRRVGPHPGLSLAAPKRHRRRSG